MMIISSDRIRIKVDTNTKDNLQDLLDNSTPKVWRAADWKFEFGIKYGSTWLDISNFTTITLQVKSSYSATEALISETISSINNSCTEDEFDDGTDQHFTVEVDRTKTALDLSGADNKDFYLLVFATFANGDSFPLGKTTLNVMDSGLIAAPSPPAGDPTYYTSAQCDAAFPTKTNNGVVLNGKWYQFVVDDSDPDHPGLGLAAGVAI